MADSTGLGCKGGALVFTAGLAILAAASYWTTVSRVFLFWAAFILTRLLGATVGDFLDKPISHGGLALSRPLASVVIAAFIVACIVICRSGQGCTPRSVAGPARSRSGFPRPSLELVRWERGSNAATGAAAHSRRAAGAELFRRGGDLGGALGAPRRPHRRCRVPGLSHLRLHHRRIASGRCRLFRDGLVPSPSRPCGAGRFLARGAGEGFEFEVEGAHCCGLGGFFPMPAWPMSAI